MKKLLIVRDRVKKKDHLLAYLRKNLENGAEVALDFWSNLTFRIEPEKVTACFGERPVQDFNLLWFRRTGEKFSHLAKTLASFLESKGIGYLDAAWGKNKIRGSKLSAYVSLALAGLPVIPSFFCSREKIIASQKKIVDALGLPLIAKDLKGSWGKGVFLLKKADDFDRLLKNSKENNNFLFQKYLAESDDYRVLVLGGRVAAWAREARLGEKFGDQAFYPDLEKERFLPLEQVSEEMLGISLAAALILDLQIAGVDILVEKATGKHWLLEVNRSPSLTSNLKVSPEMPAVADYLKSLLKNGC